MGYDDKQFRDREGIYYYLVALKGPMVLFKSMISKMIALQALADHFWKKLSICTKKPFK